MEEEVCEVAGGAEEEEAEEEKKRKAKAVAAERAMHVMRRSEIKRMVVVVGL
jgi:hypothetical protein